MSRSTPIEQLPEMQPGALNENDLVQDIIDEYNQPQQPQMQPPRPQGIQPAGMADSFHYEQAPMQQQLPPRQVHVGVTEDWQTYLTREGKVPLLAAILYFVLSLDFVDEQLMKYIPRLFNDSCEITMSGVLLKAALLGTALLLIKRFV